MQQTTPANVTSSSPSTWVSRCFSAGIVIAGMLWLASLFAFGQTAAAKTWVFQNEEQAVEVVDVAKAVAEAKAVVGGDKKKVEEKQATKEKADTPEEPIIDTSQQPAPPRMGDDQIKLHMWDGSIVGGKVSVDSISVETEFGLMTVPIRRIVEFHPGLDSFPQKQQGLKKLVEELGDGSYKVREDAHRALVEMGLPLRKEIENFSDGGSIERKKHLTEIIKEIEERLEEMADGDTAVNIRELAKLDEVVTPDMTVVGKIQQDVFYITSKFGKLEVRLEDIERASREMKAKKAEVRKTLTVSSDNFFQRKPKSTGIRVNKGDRISVRAGGVMEWTNWSKSSTPEGLTSQGKWNSIQSGTLIACIGKDNKNVQKVGVKESWVAKRSGVLYLGIAVQDSYANNSGYRWTGEYEAKVVVK